MSTSRKTRSMSRREKESQNPSHHSEEDIEVVPRPPPLVIPRESPPRSRSRSLPPQDQAEQDDSSSSSSSEEPLRRPINAVDEDDPDIYDEPGDGGSSPSWDYSRANLGDRHRSQPRSGRQALPQPPDFVLPQNPSQGLTELLAMMARSIETTQRLIQTQVQLQSAHRAGSPSGYSSTSYPPNNFKPVEFKTPQPYDGHPDRYHDFHFQLNNYITATHSRFLNDRQRVAFAGTLFEKDALTWYQRLCETKDRCLEDWTFFMYAFENRFKDPSYAIKQKKKLRDLRQDKMSIPTYITKFEAQASRTNITGPILVDFFVEGLNSDVADILVTLYEDDQPNHLAKIFSLARKAEKILLNRRNIRARETRRQNSENPSGARKQNSGNASQTGNRQTGSRGNNSAGNPRSERRTPNRTQDQPTGRRTITEEEKKRRREQGLCLYCGEAGHRADACPSLPAKNNSQSSSNSTNSSGQSSSQSGSGSRTAPRTGSNSGPVTRKRIAADNQHDDEEEDNYDSPQDYTLPPIHGPVTQKGWVKSDTLQYSIPVELSFSPKTLIKTFALYDSAASENFIDIDFCKSQGIKTLPLKKPIPLILGNGTTDHVTEYVGPLTLTVGEHTEETTLLVSTISPNHVALGLAWITKHKPNVDWDEQTLTLRSKHCMNNCGISVPTTVRLLPSHDISHPAPAVTYKAKFIGPPPTSNAVLPEIYKEFEDVFAPPDISNLPEHSKFDLKIELKDPNNLPPARPIYSLAPAEKEVLRKYISDALKFGWIRKSTSLVAAPIFFVSKKDGGLRPCVDYRELNARTVKNKFPLPLLRDLFARLIRKRKYTKVDFRNAFHQLRILFGDEWLTAFRCFLGHFEYLVMPFGLSNAPAALQAMMNEIFADMEDFIVVYLDDILIFSDNEEDHVRHVTAVLQRLRERKLYAKLEKSFFHLDVVEFLGFIVSYEGIRLAEDKLELIRKWPTPRNLLDLQSFIGFANFYRDSVPHFSGITIPLTHLTKKSVKWTWNEEHDRAFSALKAAIINAPTRAHPDFDRDFSLQTDASAYALGAVLLQPNDLGTLMPVLFHSRKFNSAELNYSVYDKELLAIVEAFSVWRHFLIGAVNPVTVFTDHKNLLFFSQRRILTPRHARWSQILSEFRFILYYRPGPENVLADAASRHPQYQKETADYKQEFMATLLTPEIFHGFPSENSEIPENPVTCKTIVPYSDKGKESDNRIDISDNLALQRKVMESRHDKPLGGHFGITKTLELISRDFTWEGMRKAVKAFVATCEICQRNKKSRHLPYGLLMPLPISKIPWSAISIDFITKLPLDNAYDSILVTVDRATKMAHFVPTTESITSIETARLLVEYVIKLHGLPDSILSDRGPQFISRVWKELLSIFKIERKLSSAYHPQTDGQTERVNQILEQYLRCYINYQQDDWSSWLPLAEFAYNNAHKPDLGTSPFFLNYGFHPRMDFLSRKVPEGVPPALSPDGLTAFREGAVKMLEQANKDNAKYANRKRTDVDFKVGDQVFVSTINMKTNRPTKKLDYRMIGPYPIIEKINEVAYKVALPKTVKVHPVFHVSLLEPAKLDTDEFRAKPDAPPPVLIDEEYEWEVEEILDSRIYRRKLQYYVKWKGWDITESSWLPAENLDHAKTLVKKFHAKYPNKPGPGGSPSSRG